MRGESVFITGGAGVGKSFTLNQVVSQLRREHGDERVSPKIRPRDPRILGPTRAAFLGPPPGLSSGDRASYSWMPRRLFPLCAHLILSAPTAISWERASILGCRRRRRCPHPFPPRQPAPGEPVPPSPLAATAHTHA
eukprot:scaffold22482_cov62-Isochrysis_galbana.AAC.1